MQSECISAHMILSHSAAGVAETTEVILKVCSGEVEQLDPAPTTKKNHILSNSVTMPEVLKCEHISRTKRYKRLRKSELIGNTAIWTYAREIEWGKKAAR